MTLIGGSYIAVGTAGLLESSEAPATPTTPAITAADDETGTSVTVTVAGDDTVTNRLYYRSSAATAWTTGLTRVGDGDIQQTGLTAGIYIFVVVSDDGGVYSLPSNIAVVTVTSAALTPSDLVSLPLYYLKQTVAGSATFQAWVGASTAAEALNHVHEVEVDMPVLRPTVTAGALASVAVEYGGAYYDSAPGVTVYGDGSGATATATVANGTITAVTVTEGGSGYTQAGTRAEDIVAAMPLPLAVVDWDAWSRQESARGMRIYMEQGEGSSLVVLFRDEISAANQAPGESRSAAYTFLNTLGAIVSEMEALSGTAGYLAITGVEMSQGPQRPDAESARTVGHFYECQFTVRYEGL